MKITHPELVKALCKPGQQIAFEMDAEGAHLLHMAVGICGEAGELIDTVKRHVIYRQPIDRANVIEELGDLEFYMEGLRQRLFLTREETLEGNIAKLTKRYEKKYSDEKAKARADKSMESVAKDVNKQFDRAQAEARTAEEKLYEMTGDPRDKPKQGGVEQVQALEGRKLPRVNVDPAQPGADKTVVTEHVRVVHHLHQGVPACGFMPGQVPKDWPLGHLWSATWAEVDCIACLATPGHT